MSELCVRIGRMVSWFGRVAPGSFVFGGEGTDLINMVRMWAFWRGREKREVVAKGRERT